MKNFILLLNFFLVSCSDSLDKLKRLGKAPPLSQVKIPQDESFSNYDAEENYLTHVKTTNSLWKPGATTFFRDNRAWNVGDILKVVVEIKDSAKLDSSTKQSRNAADNMKATDIFGQEKKLAQFLNGSEIINPLLNLASKYNHNGAGNIDRKENITTQIAANVTQVLPNGNLVIFGHQEVRVNHELREIKVAGIIRPKDISSLNAIKLDQIAQARVSYGGKGVVSDIQNPKIVTQALEIIKPF